MMPRLYFVACCVLAVACGGGSASPDGGTVDGGADSGTVDAQADAFTPSDAGEDAGLEDAGLEDAGPDAPEAPSCLDSLTVGDEVVDSDHCNVCTCQPDGSFACTDRACPETLDGGCEYGGVRRAYGVRFSATDGCNECVCAASGLACTRRDCSDVEEGAILLEGLDQPCGRDGFTADAVLRGLPYTELTAPFRYDRAASLYPETRPDTALTLSLHYLGGFLVCRIPREDQVAMDIEIAARWQTADGAFDEVFHTYLRRNDFGFVDAWTMVAARNHDALVGSYSLDCLDPNGLSFSAQIDADGGASATISKTCEVDIGLAVGDATRPPD